MPVEFTHHFEIVTTNPARARSIQEVLPGGRAVHIPRSPVDEDLSKGLAADPVELVKRISQYKASRDLINIGGMEGIGDQLKQIGKSPKDIYGFSWIARFTSDTIRVVYDAQGDMTVQHKPTAREILHLPEKVSGKRAAILTAITELAIPLAGMFTGYAETNITAHLATVVVWSEFQFKPFTSRVFTDFVKDIGIDRMLRISGGIPIETRSDSGPNPLVDWQKGITVTMFAGQERTKIAEGDVKPEQCVHGTFPAVIQSLLESPGTPLPPRGDIYTH